MALNNLLGKVNIIGVGATPRGKLPEYTADDIAVWAFAEALKDSGLQKSDIDGLLVQGSFRGAGQRRHRPAG